MRIRSKSAAEFAVFTPLETATMPSTIRRLDISRDQIIVDILPRFKYLRSLKIFYLASQLPCLPSLIELTLTNCHFSSYSSFMDIISAVPSLQNLVLIGLTLGPSDDDPYQLSTHDLDSLYLAWSPDEFRRLIPFRTRRLTLEPPFDVSSDVSGISRYLRHLGGYITYMHLVLHGMLMDPRTHRLQPYRPPSPPPNQPPRSSVVFAVPLDLEHFLGLIPPAAVPVIDANNLLPPTPLTHFAALFRTSEFASIGYLLAVIASSARVVS
ncbi:hypothetical protein B0H13DRAFT_2305098 [Mycena leptocephala]|nr:hypothetical protein B0H13DRAFT_2305098 [Mycena leptocephala]